VDPCDKKITEEDRDSVGGNKALHNRIPCHLQDSGCSYFSVEKGYFHDTFNPLTPELNPSAQRCLTRIFTGDFAS
jgi:hypothetical protein